MDQLELVRKRVRDMRIGSVPSPWVRIGTWAVGGLIEVGFGLGRDLLLIVSSQGRGVLDTEMGTKVARDYNQPDDAWHDPFNLCARGIGPLTDENVRVAGLNGGGLAKTTRDGWWTESLTLVWPEQHLIIGGPWGSVHDAGTKFAKLAVESEVRAFGFSPSGRTLVVATSSDVELWTRK